jgi:DNA-binding transcriptional LysR family regulator
MLACPRDHRLAARRHVELSALADEPFADLPQGWGTRMAIDRAFATAGVRRTIAFEVNDTASVIEFVRHGLAVAMVAPSFVSESDDLALVTIRRHAPIFEVSLAVPANRRLGAAAAELVAAARRWAVGSPPLR